MLFRSQAKQNAQDTIAELLEKTREKAQEFKTLAAQTAQDAREGDVEVTICFDTPSLCSQ